jgi:cytochrome P450 family 150 subfamily A5
MTDFESVDYFFDKSVTADPFPYWDHLRERCPVTREPHHGIVMITGYDEVMSVYHDQVTWSNCNTVAGLQGFPVPLEGDDVSDLIEEHRDKLIFAGELPSMDPPKHTAHRGLLMRLITPKRLNENEAYMWDLADRQIEEFLDRGRVEFITEFAQPFTALIVADLEGVPEEDRAAFREEMTGNQLERRLKGDVMDHDPLAYLHERFFGYVEERRREPRDDVLTGLATATFPDGSLPEVHEVVRIAANLFAAGQETTVRLLSAALQKIAEDPELQDALRQDRRKIPNFIEETLRFETPLKGQFRLSRVPTTVGGVDLPAGTTVSIIPAAANRDPRQFECPNEFRADRPNARQHLAFGHGIHTCAGAPLARAEGRIAVERLLARMSDIRISEQEHGPPESRRYQYLPTWMIRGLTQLHLEFTPAA